MHRPPLASKAVDKELELKRKMRQGIDHTRGQLESSNVIKEVSQQLNPDENSSANPISTK